MQLFSFTVYKVEKVEIMSNATIRSTLINVNISINGHVLLKERERNKTGINKTYLYTVYAKFNLRVHGQKSNDNW